MHKKVQLTIEICMDTQTEQNTDIDMYLVQKQHFSNLSGLFLYCFVDGFGMEFVAVHSGMMFYTKVRSFKFAPNA